MTDTDKAAETKTWGLHEIFPDQAAAEGDKPGEQAAYTGTYRTTDGHTVTVNAWRGTQAFGWSNGNPLDMTKFGTVVLTFAGQDDKPVVAITISDDGEGHSFMETLRQAFRVADTRDHTNDQPYPND
jgi:hypothetical protein